MSSPKKHHYVPEAHLRNFSRADKPDQIWVYDKLKSRKFSSAVRDTGSEGNYNTIEVEGGKLNLEPIFDQIDALGPPLVKSICEAERLDFLTGEQRHNVTLLVATQILRAKIRRTSTIDFMEQLGESARKRGLNPEEFENFDIISEEDAKRISFQSFSGLNELAEAFRSKVAVLHKIRNASVWISDNPVVTFNSFPYGDQGIESPGVEIYYPLSARFILAFYCPSIGERLRTFQGEGEEYSALLLQGMRERCAVDSSAHLEFFNSLQVAQSHRFVFSSTEDFSLAERIVREKPDLARISHQK
jgi:hypothetical protein